MWRMDVFTYHWQNLLEAKSLGEELNGEFCSQEAKELNGGSLGYV
jgi:hypothetical protein